MIAFKFILSIIIIIHVINVAITLTAVDYITAFFMTIVFILIVIMVDREFLERNILGSWYYLLKNRKGRNNRPNL